MISIVPSPGSPGFDEFLRKAQKPGSMESKAMEQMMTESANQAQQHLRGMLQKMIEVVPGQLFRDVSEFHKKFELSPTASPGHAIQTSVASFRIKFMLEELSEYAESLGFYIHSGVLEPTEYGNGGQVVKFNAEKAFDGLIDLAYVVLGTAYLHRFPFNEGWARVQEANMAKVRATGDDDPRSVRKSSIDIVKPEGWKPPVLTDLLDETCGGCLGFGCVECKQTGMVKRKAES
jgi:predicted HAD superfamily Cof-like phosphohydrolase